MHDACDAGPDDRHHIVAREAGADVVHADEHRYAAGDHLRQQRADERSRGALRSAGYGIFQIDDDSVGAGARCAFEQALTVAGHEEECSQHIHRSLRAQLRSADQYHEALRRGQRVKLQEMRENTHARRRDAVPTSMKNVARARRHRVGALLPAMAQR